jgi:hypothetical protein
MNAEPILISALPHLAAPTPPPPLIARQDLRPTSGPHRELSQGKIATRPAATRQHAFAGPN